MWLHCRVSHCSSHSFRFAIISGFSVGSRSRSLLGASVEGVWTSTTSGLSGAVETWTRSFFQQFAKVSEWPVKQENQERVALLELSAEWPVKQKNQERVALLKQPEPLAQPHLIAVEV